MAEKTFGGGVGNLIRLLPTGTVFLFQFLNPLITNNGKCNTINKYLTGSLIFVCGLSCCFASFTDSYTDNNGITYYGIATKSGFWISTDSGPVDSSKYKLERRDFVHALISMAVFVVVCVLDTNTVKCFYPSFVKHDKVLLMVLPLATATIASSVYAVFPNKRRGFGYPPEAARVQLPQ